MFAVPHPKRLFSLLSAAVVLVSLISAAPGQDADADRAKALLGQGLAQFKILNFRAAKATLLQVDSDALPETDRRTLDDHLSKVDAAIRAQAAASEAFRAAEKALRAGNLADARKGFAAAAASEYLPPQTRQDAEAQLALVKRKMEVAAAAAAAKAAEEKAAADKAAAAKAAEEKAAAAKAAEEKAAADKVAAKKTVAAAAAARKTISAKAVADRHEQALKLLAAGNMALDDHRTAVAVLCFQRALALEPDLTEARKQLNYARGLLGTASEAGPIGRLDRLRRIRLQEANVVLRKHLTRSHEVLTTARSEADFDEARSAAEMAKNILEADKSLFARNDYRANRALVENQLKFIRLKRETWQRQQAEKQRIALKVAETERSRREYEQRRQKIAILTARARALIGQSKYPEAREEVERIIALDSENLWAVEQKEMLDQFVVLLEERWIHKTLLAEEQKSLLAVREAMIPWYNELQYPSDWVELSVRRLGRATGAAAESEANRAARAKLKTRLTRLDFDDIEFGDVIKFLRDVSGVNIYVKWQALSAAGVERATTVNVHLGNITVEKALQIILDDVGGVNPLGFVVEDGVVTVTSKEDLQTRTITRVYDIRDMIFRIPNFKGPRMDLELNSGAGAGGGGGAGAGAGGDLFGQEGGEEETMSKAELVSRIIETIRTTVDPPSWTDETRVGIRELHGQLIVTQTAENHLALLRLIGKLREARALQICIEARFILVTSGFLNRVGLDLDIFFNLRSRLASGATMTAPGSPGAIEDPWSGGWINPKTGVPGSGTSFSDKFMPVRLNQDTWDWTSTILGGLNITNVSNAFSTVPIAMAIQGAFLDDIQVEFLMEATQAQVTRRTLSAPRIMLFNGQRAYIAVAEVQAYIASYEPMLGENASGAGPRIGYIPTGTVLEVEATVSADRRYVTMTVRPQIADLISLRSGSIADPDIPGSTRATVHLPEVYMQDLSTTVSVPDGGTMLLGGLKTGGDFEREMGAPILNKIPFINRFFLNRAKVREAETLLILIKPKIIIHREEEEKAFPGMELPGT